MAHAVPLELQADAEQLVRDAVQSLSTLGIAAEGRSSSVFQDHVAGRIVEEAAFWECQAIVLGSRRVRGIGRLSGRGVRERVLRLSALPVSWRPLRRAAGASGHRGSGLTESSPQPPAAGRTAVSPILGSVEWAKR